MCLSCSKVLITRMRLEFATFVLDHHTQLSPSSPPLLQVLTSSSQSPQGQGPSSPSISADPTPPGGFSLLIPLPHSLHTKICCSSSPTVLFSQFKSRVYINSVRDFHKNQVNFNNFCTLFGIILVLSCIVVVIYDNYIISCRNAST